VNVQSRDKQQLEEERTGFLELASLGLQSSSMLGQQLAYQMQLEGGSQL
jgi:hypothetical protein